MDAAAREQILLLRDNPRLLGYYSDNELGWWNATLWKITLEQPSTSGQRRRLIQLLPDTYQNNWNKLALDFEIRNAANWSQLQTRGMLFLRPGGNGMVAMRHFLSLLADRYYQLTRDIIRKYDRRAMSGGSLSILLLPRSRKERPHSGGIQYQEKRLPAHHRDPLQHRQSLRLDVHDSRRVRQGSMERPAMKTKTHIKTRAPNFSEMPRDYAGLVGLFPLRPLKDDVDADNVTEIVDALAGHPLNQDQEDYLDVLSTLLADFEDKRHPVRLAKSSPLRNLKRLLDEHGMSASDLGRLLGNLAMGSKLLRGERELSLANIRKLMKHFAVDASLFI